MQNVDPKDRPKLYALIGAAVVVFGIVIFVTMQSIASVSPQHPASTPAPPPVASAAGATGATATPAAPGAPVVAGAAPPPGTTPTTFIVDGPLKQGRDPFAPVPDDRLAREAVRVIEIFPQKKPTPGQTAAKNTLVSSLPMIGPVINKGIRDLQTQRSELGSISDDIDKVSKTPSVEVLPLAPPPYVVSGVLIGEPGGRDVAILRSVPGGDRRFVVVGEKLDGGFMVTSISSDGVKVRPTTPGSTGSETSLSRQTDTGSAPVTLPIGGAMNPTAK
jgi:hypothetical protein